MADRGRLSIRTTRGAELRLATGCVGPDILDDGSDGTVADGRFPAATTPRSFWWLKSSDPTRTGTRMHEACTVRNTKARILSGLRLSSLVEAGLAAGSRAPEGRRSPRLRHKINEHSASRFAAAEHPSAAASCQMACYSRRCPIWVRFDMGERSLRASRMRHGSSTRPFP